MAHFLIFILLLFHPAEKIFSAFFFAIPKIFPIFAMLNIYRIEAGDVRQLRGLFLCPSISHIIPALGNLIGSVPCIVL